MKHILFGILYLIKYWFGRDSTPPLICGIVLHNKCNLRCKHCTLVNRPEHKISYTEAIRVIDDFYAKGGRCLYLEGGEPFLWKDGNFGMEDIIQYAKTIGYHSITVYTNGTQPINSSADIIFVSIDGPEPINDSLRGKSFNRIAQNINKSGHPSIYVNYTINSVNFNVIEDYCIWAESIPQIRGTFFYFHTPYYGYDKLFMNKGTKAETIKKLLLLKKEYSILNSTAGLKSALKNNWKKRLSICQVYEGGKYYTCCRENNNGKTCFECGYLSYAEIHQTLRLKPSAIRNALKYF